MATVNAEKVKAWIDAIRADYGATMQQVSRAQLHKTWKKHKLPWCNWLVTNTALKAGRGLFLIPSAETSIAVTASSPTQTRKVNKRKRDIPSNLNINAVTLSSEADATQEKQDSNNTSERHVTTNGITVISPTTRSMVPEKDPTFVRWGSVADIEKVLRANIFYPIFISGESGNGKTLGVLQACANTGRECYRVNIVEETDEDDLLGGFRIINGETVWHNGPVVEAMERGSVLLLDEMTLGTHKILCLMPVLEGKGVFLKKIGRYIKPAPGFTVIATANTKGKTGSGRYIGCNMFSEAFLDRFTITIEQDYPGTAVETKILTNVANKIGIVNSDTEDFINKLVDWAQITRKTYIDGGIDEQITTRRLVDVLVTFAIFTDKLDAISKCVARFDETVKDAMVEMYKKIDISVAPKNTTEPVAPCDWQTVVPTVV